MDHNNQKKIAAINDLSGFGKCSLSVALPLISKLGVQCCPLPTAVLSDHTGFDSYYFVDFSEHMEPYIDEWKKLNLRFDGILTGFLGSEEQIETVKSFIEHFADENTVVIVDPVMGDNGNTYATYTHEMCKGISKLVEHANIITPNVTEACILTGIPYKEHFSESELHEMTYKLCEKGPDMVVITGVDRGVYLENYVYQKDDGPRVLRTRRIAPQRSGTGDVFASIVAACFVQGLSFEKSVRKAADFIKECLKSSTELDIPVTDGVCFEKVIDKLHL